MRFNLFQTLHFSALNILTATKILASNILLATSNLSAGSRKRLYDR